MRLLFAKTERSLKRWARHIRFSKRQSFVLVTAFLTVGLLLTQLAPSSDLRYPMVIGLSLLTYGLAAVALREDLGGVEWVTILTLPTLFTAAVALFYFLLPTRWLTRLPIAILYAMGMYGLLLTENIYNVAANRTIGLLRAAHTVGFLLTLLSFFLLTQTVLAYRLGPFANTMLVVVIAYPLVFQSLWSMDLGQKPSREVSELTAIVVLVLAQVGWIFSFWPIPSTMRALLLTTMLYSLEGMAQQYLSKRLYKKTVIEFFFVTVFVLIVVLLTTRWRGNL